jgi:DNA sulfur modification protein DndC
MSRMLDLVRKGLSSGTADSPAPRKPRRRARAQGGEPRPGWTIEEQGEAQRFIRDPGLIPPHRDARPDTAVLGDLLEYDYIIVQFSGGKDSIAALLHLLDLGVPLSKIELWHQNVDGDPKDGTIMDWPVTESYCRAFAAAFGVSIRFQWKVGGIIGEARKQNARTAPTMIEVEPGRHISVGGERGTIGTRRMFPAKSADLRTRWCSAVAKIDVSSKQITNDPRFNTRIHGPMSILVVTGERREESGNRARYAEVEKGRGHTQKRTVVQWRNVLGWNEAKVWSTLRRWGVAPHPVYAAGYGRASCALCIFGGKDEWATARQLLPDQFDLVAGLERDFGHTIHGRTRTINKERMHIPVPVGELADKGQSLITDAERRAAARQLSNPVYTGEILIDPRDWRLPGGAFHRTAGPT